MVERLRRLPPAVIDAAVAAAVGLVWVCAWNFWRSRGWIPQFRDLWHLAGAWTVGALALRRVAPGAVLAAASLVYPWWYDVGLRSELHLLPPMIAGASVAALGRRWAVGAFLGAAFSTFALTTGLRVRMRSGLGPFDAVELDRLIVSELLVLGVVVLGAMVGTFRRMSVNLAERNAELERLRVVEAAAAVHDERTRIARELHDVVAHHLTAMVVRTQAATHVGADRSPDDRELLEWVTSTAREALDATRHTVRALRDPGEAAALAPAPTLVDLDAAVERVRAVGVDATVEIDDGLPQLEPAVGMAVVRIAQEGLTNVMKHAPAGRASVSVRRAGVQVVVRVDDDGTPPPPDFVPAPASTGYRGLTERAGALGGSVRVEASPLGGWALVGILPLHPTGVAR